MISSLFRIFDFISFNRPNLFIVLVLVIIFLVSIFKCYKSILTPPFICLNGLFRLISKEHKIVLTKDLSLLMILSLFALLCVVNILGLFPDVFCSSTHVRYVLGFSLVVFISTVVKKKIFFVHLCPKGSPLVLSFLLVLIELVSLFIRPITLTLRLVANIISGHLILTLRYRSLSYLTSLFNYLRVGVILSLMERFVSVIQSFVFSLLVTLYISESIGK